MSLGQTYEDLQAQMLEMGHEDLYFWEAHEDQTVGMDHEDCDGLDHGDQIVGEDRGDPDSSEEHAYLSVGALDEVGHADPCVDDLEDQLRDAEEVHEAQKDEDHGVQSTEEDRVDYGGQVAVENGEGVQSPEHPDLVLLRQQMGEGHVDLTEQEEVP